MIKLKIILLIISLLIFSSCSDTENKISNLKTNIIKNENKTYNEVVNENEGLKNATSEDLDKILLEKIRILNTPTSKYPFFEQLTNKKGDIQEIARSGGMEITRGQIYLHGLDLKYKFINDLLSDNEKLYSFNMKNNENNFFFLDGTTENFIKKIKNLTKSKNKYKEISNNNQMINLEILNNGNKYIITLLKSIQFPRDNIDKILGTSNKVKVTINILK